MANLCSEYSVRGCPASCYLICPAYLSDKNCWEVEKKPCCRKPKLSDCRNCEVYKAARSLVPPYVSH